MAQQDNRDLVRQIFEAWNAHDAERYVRHLDKGFVFESDTLPAPVRGADQARQLFQMYVAAFPDLHFDLQDVLADGDWVVVRWHSKATHRGEFMGIAPTNRFGELNGCSVTEVRDGKAIRTLNYFDRARLLENLGVLEIRRRAA